MQNDFGYGEKMIRLLNYILYLLIAVVVLPIILFFALFIFLYDRHNPFYVSVRIGKNGKSFKMIKLRSMCVDSWKYKIDSTANNDPRITPIGKIVRKFKIDELTQIINVLKGNMNIVGPRPQVETEVNHYTSVERAILKVKPGITDIASIVFSDEGDILNGAKDPDLLYAQIERPWKSRLALLYIENVSVWLDLRLMFYTVTNMFAKKWTLDKLSKIVRQWKYDAEDLPEIVARRKSLYAYPVPGADKVIEAL